MVWLGGSKSTFGISLESEPFDSMLGSYSKKVDERTEKVVKSSLQSQDYENNSFTEVEKEKKSEKELDPKFIKAPLEKLRRGVRNLIKLTRGVAQAKKLGYKGKALEPFYWMEALHPSHEVGASINRRVREWKDSKSNLSFWEWEQVHYPNLKVKSDVQVKYLSLKERQKHEVQISNGILMQDGRPFITQNNNSVFSGEGSAIFVVAPNGRIYAGSHVLNQFHHSSFISGEAIIGAGEIVTDKKGKIIRITNQSGHYRPGSHEMLEVLETLKKKGVDLKGVELQIVAKPGSAVFPSAMDYFKKKGEILPERYVRFITNKKTSERELNEFLLVQDKKGKIIQAKRIKGDNVQAEESVLEFLKSFGVNVSKTTIL